MYGGNANFYHLPLSEYAQTVDFLAETAGKDSWVIPSAGADYGKLMDTAKILRRPTAEIEAILGYVSEPELIHRDNLVIL